MIEEDFFVGGTVGAGQSRKSDVVRLRKALRQTGHSRPSGKPSGTYDRSLHDAVLRFQNDFGLKEDGIVGPGGPTQTALNIAHTALKSGGSDGYESVRGPFAALHRAGYRFEPAKENSETGGRWVGPDGRAASSDRLRGALGQRETRRLHLAMYPDRDPISGQPTFPGDRRPRRYLEGGGGGGVPRGNHPAGELVKSLFKHLFDDDAAKPNRKKNSAPASESAPMDRPPDDLPKQVPPYPAEPPPDPEKGKEEIKAEEPRPFILPGLEPEEVRPGVFIFPDQSDRFNRPQIVEDRRGNNITKAFNDEVRDWFLNELGNGDRGWRLVAGGRDKDTGADIKEKAVPNPLKDFERKKIEGKVDGRKGSKFPDLTFQLDHVEVYVHIQTVDLDNNGKPTQRELDNADRIARRTGDPVILVGKPWQRMK